jgi:hypothetical protein
VHKENVPERIPPCKILVSVFSTAGSSLRWESPPAALGFITLFYGIGQAVAPSVAGAIADLTGSFGPAFLLAGIVAFAGAVGSLFLRL